MTTAIVLIALPVRGGAPTAGPAAAGAVDVRRVCGLTAAPTACATVRYDVSARLATLTATGLGPSYVVAGQASLSYEVWLVRPNGYSVAGAFLTHDLADGGWSAVVDTSASDYVAVAVTREPPEGSIVPMGPELLRVSLAG